MFDMQKNGEFQFGRIYVTPKSPVIYELKERRQEIILANAKDELGRTRRSIKIYENYLGSE